MQLPDAVIANKDTTNDNRNSDQAGLVSHVSNITSESNQQSTQNKVNICFS